jgi:hypothetical protein
VAVVAYKNKEDFNAYQRNRRATKWAEVRATELRSQFKTRHGIELAYEEALKFINRAQNEVCGVCGRKTEKALNVDHDHLTLRIRGLLCHNCNVILGLVGDDPEILEKLARYLYASSEPQTATLHGGVRTQSDSYEGEVSG